MKKSAIDGKLVPVLGTSVKEQPLDSFLGSGTVVTPASAAWFRNSAVGDSPRVFSLEEPAASWLHPVGRQ